MAGSVFLLLCTVVLTGVLGAKDIVDFSKLVDCGDVSSVLGFHQKCFDLYGVDIKMPDADKLLNSSVDPQSVIGDIINIQDPKVNEKICADIDGYVQAYLCTGLINRKCLGEAQNIPIFHAMLPPEAVVRQRMNFFCANIHNFNSSCVKNVAVKIAGCVNVTGIGIGIDPLNMNASEVLQMSKCVSYQVAAVCAKKYIAPCGAMTLQLYEVNRPDTASVCPTTDVGGNGTSVQPALDCGDESSIRRAYLMCLGDEGIGLYVPEMRSSEETSSYILNYLSLRYSKQMCSNLDKYKSAIKCTLGVHRQCSSAAMKVTVPDTDTVQRGWEHLCSQIGDFESACVTNSTSNACSMRRRRSFAEQIILRHLCDDDHFRQTCLVSSAKQCSTQTVLLYKMLLASQSPAKCLSASGQLPVVG